MKYVFRLIDIINNYRHTVILPQQDLEGNVVEGKERIREKLIEGDFEIVWV